MTPGAAWPFVNSLEYYRVAGRSPLAGCVAIEPACLPSLVRRHAVSALWRCAAALFWIQTCLLRSGIANGQTWPFPERITNPTFLCWGNALLALLLERSAHQLLEISNVLSWHNLGWGEHAIAVLISTGIYQVVARDNQEFFGRLYRARPCVSQESQAAGLCFFRLMTIRKPADLEPSPIPRPVLDGVIDDLNPTRM